MRAQAVLETLSHSDFEEIRSYRKPPTSVVLVVEGKKINYVEKIKNKFNQPTDYLRDKLR